MMAGYLLGSAVSSLAWFALGALTTLAYHDLRKLAHHDERDRKEKP